jgi:hypothetical protein
LGTVVHTCHSSYMGGLVRRPVQIKDMKSRAQKVNYIKFTTNIFSLISLYG